MFIDELLSSGAIPSLETTFRFAGARQNVIIHNIANLETPNFRPLDVSTDGFQRALGRAIQKRRETSGGMFGDLNLEDTREIHSDQGGNLTLTPKTGSGSILFHDRNNSDVERLMQANAENAMVYRTTSEMLHGRYQQLKDVIAQRV
jgi:flagellar basal-body rod protein FlgB